MPNAAPVMVKRADPEAARFVTDVDDKEGPTYERDCDKIATVCDKETITRGDLATEKHDLMTT
jgi:hypothetical protein